MKLSIIVPVYNVEKYLSTCLDSVITQTFTDWELILVDDGSTDKSGQICDDYVNKNARIRVVHTANSGPSAARNLGMSLAVGDYITFIDADDYIKPTFLSNYSYNPNLDCEIQGIHLCFPADSSKDKDITPQETKVAPVSEIYSEAELLRLSRGPCCKLFKRAIIVENKVDFPLGIDFAEDAVFVKRYLAHCRGKARSIAKADYVYMHYQSTDSLTSKRHSGQMMYDVALMDYNLFKQLEHNWGEMPVDVKQDFVHIRALEFYNSICLFLTEENQTFSTCNGFLQHVKNGMFQKIKNEPCIPTTYIIIKSILTLPSSLAVILLKLFFMVKKPIV